MKRSSYVLLFLFCLQAACSTPDGDGIPPEKMQHILYDMNAAEVYSTLVKKDGISLASRTKDPDSLARYYNEILAHYNVTRAEFDKSMLWYKSHPSRLDSLYNNMIPDLTKEGTTLLQKK